MDFVIITVRPTTARLASLTVEIVLVSDIIFNSINSASSILKNRLSLPFDYTKRTLAFNDVYPLCDVYDTTRIGNGYCANLPDINNAACGFDGGDCQAFNENITYAECKVIDASRLGDGFCDGFLSEDPTQFNSEACVYDGGDCLLLNKYPNCSLSWFSTRRFGGEYIYFLEYEEKYVPMLCMIEADKNNCSYLII